MVSEERGLTVFDDIDRQLEAIGDDVGKLAALDRMAAYVARYGQSHADRIAATVAKLKVARHGGRVLIEMVPRHEREDRGGDRRSKSRHGTLKLADLGLTRNRSSRWQSVARLVQDAYDKRLAAILSEDLDDSLAAQIMGGTKASTSVEWYTPARYIEAAREVMGGIDLDPATSARANRTVKAARIFTAESDGLAHEWAGRVWLNPPYGKGSGQFTTKLIEEYDAGRVVAAVLLLNAYGFDAEWFRPLWRFPICFTDHRIQFTSPQRETGGPANGNIFAYLGTDDRRFADVFRQFGQVVRAWP
jgi:DNA N-6-adenine-methyltransferase (Dam)